MILQSSIENTDFPKRLIIDKAHVSLPSLENEFQHRIVRDKYVSKPFLYKNVLISSEKM